MHSNAHLQQNAEHAKVHIHHLEIHVSHACNLRCANCSHYCDIGYPQKINHDDALGSILAWSKKLHIDQFALLGGEPLLEKRVTEYVRIAAEAFPLAERRLVTNGVLLHAHDDALAQAIKETNTRLIISSHAIPENQKPLLAKSLSKLKHWIQKYALNVTIKPIDSRWFKLYHGLGKKMLPFDDRCPEQSRARCVTPCVNLHEGALWKCPPLAYLPMVIESLHYKKAWEPYLAYRPLQLSASVQELAHIATDSHCCAMCPKTPKLDLVQHAL